MCGNLHQSWWYLDASTYYMHLWAFPCVESMKPRMEFVRFFGVSRLWYLFQELIQCIWHKQTRAYQFRLQPIHLLWYDFFPVILSWSHNTFLCGLGMLVLGICTVTHFAYSWKIVLSLVSWNAYAQHHDRSSQFWWSIFMSSQHFGSSCFPNEQPLWRCYKSWASFMIITPAFERQCAAANLRIWRIYMFSSSISPIQDWAFCTDTKVL